jgi:hypothetical protein
MALSMKLPVELQNLINKIPKQIKLDTNMNKFNLFENINNINSNKEIIEYNLLQIIERIIAEDDVTISYYEINDMFEYIKKDPIITVNLALTIILRYQSLLKETLDVDATHANGMSLEEFVHIWKMNQDFCRKLFSIMKKYQIIIADNNIPHHKNEINIISILEIVTFYKNIYCSKYNYNGKEVTLGEIIETIAHDTDKRNIENVYDYINACKAFNYMEFYLDEQCNDTIVKKILSDNIIVNNICFYMDKLLRNSLNINTINETLVVENVEKVILTKIYRIIYLLCNYADKDFVYKCYVKFLQKRIMDLEYANIELELELINQLKDFIGNRNVQVLKYMIDDLRHSRKFNEEIHDLEINIESEKFKPLMQLPRKITLKPINAVVIRPNIWQDINFTEKDLNLPLELEFYKQTIERFYQLSYEENICIKWIYNLGNAIVSFNINNQNVHLKVNIYQLIVIMYLNESEYITIDKLSDDTKIPRELCKTIIYSFCIENILSIIINIEPHEERYVVNANFISMTNFINLIESFKKSILNVSKDV